MSSTAPTPHSKPSTAKIDSRWVRYRAAAYLSGRGLSFGMGPDAIVPPAAQDLGKYSLSIDSIRYPGLMACDLDLSAFAKGFAQHVFVGPRLSAYADPDALLAGLVERLADGGHLVIHLTECEGERLDWLRSLLGSCASWQEKDTYIRDRQVLGVWKLLGRGKRGIASPRPRAARRACIARYGAIGDMIMLSPLIEALAGDGYEVTMNVTPYCAEVLRHNPHVSNIVVQERDIIPNPDLGGYWAEWMGDYDKYINLSESIEGGLLKVEGRRDFYTTKAWRASTFGTINYQDHTMKLGGYPDRKGMRPHLYFSKAERKAAAWVRSKYEGKFLILWALKGSSYHKQYPLLRSTLSKWLGEHPRAYALLAGAEGDRALAFEHPQVLELCGRIPLRETFALTQVVDLVAGPETAITNAASCFDTPKLLMLSHSSQEQLTKYWTNTLVLEPTSACYPCSQLHYEKTSCPTTKLVQLSPSEAVPIAEVPVCCSQGLLPAQLINALDSLYAVWEVAHVQ